MKKIKNKKIYINTHVSNLKHHHKICQQDKQTNWPNFTNSSLYNRKKKEKKKKETVNVIILITMPWRKGDKE